MLFEGQILRFKGRSATTVAAEFEKLLHGRCKRVGDALEITRETHIGVIQPRSEEAQTIPMFGLEPGVIGSNGHSESPRVEQGPLAGFRVCEK